MKKTIITLAALTLVLSMTGCSGSAAQNSDSVAETTVASETETTASNEETVAETTTEETTETTAADTTSETAADTTAESAETAAETTVAAGTQTADEAELIAQSKKLLEEYMTIDRASASDLSNDQNDNIPTDVEGLRYYRVTEDGYQSLDALKKLIDATLTGDLAAQIKEEWFEQEMPRYIEKDGKLYMLPGGRGNGFSFVTDTIAVSDITDNSFKATFDSKGFNQEIFQNSMIVTRTDNGYRISSMQSA